MGDQRTFDLALARLDTESEEVEAVGVLQTLAGEVRLRLGQTPLEVGQRPPEALVGVGLDLHRQHATRPTMLDACSDVPVTLGRVFELVEQGAEVEPGQFVQQLLHDLRVRPGLGKRPHVLEVPHGEALGLGEGHLP